MMILWGVAALANAKATQPNLVAGVISSGTWFNLSLEQLIMPIKGEEAFSAKIVDPIYNQAFSAILIPANAKVSGTYRNTGNRCVFAINTIKFKNTEIELHSGAYSVVNASVPKQIECNPHLSYGINQQLEFKTLVAISGLEPFSYNRSYVTLHSRDSFVQTVGNEDYMINGIQKYSNGLMQVGVKFIDKSLKSKLLPVYYDDYGIVHFLNYTLVTDPDSLGQSDTQSYLMLGDHDKFGFGILK